MWKRQFAVDCPNGKAYLNTVSILFQRVLTLKAWAGANFEIGLGSKRRQASWRHRICALFDAVVVRLGGKGAADWVKTLELAAKPEPGQPPQQIQAFKMTEGRKNKNYNSHNGAWQLYIYIFIQLCVYLFTINLLIYLFLHMYSILLYSMVHWKILNIYWFYIANYCELLRHANHATTNI